MTVAERQAFAAYQQLYLLRCLYIIRFYQFAKAYGQRDSLEKDAGTDAGLFSGIAPTEKDPTGHNTMGGNCGAAQCMTDGEPNGRSVANDQKEYIGEYDAKSKTLVVDGIKFTNVTPEKRRAGQRELWQNLANAAKDSGAEEIKIGSVARSKGTHVDGYSADVLSVKFSGKPGQRAEEIEYNRYATSEQRGRLTKFENAFMAQSSSEAAWTPNQMLSRSSGKAAEKQGYISDYYTGTSTGANQLDNYPQISNARALQIKTGNNDDAKEINKYLQGKYPSMSREDRTALAGSIQHVDHGHFMVRRP